MDKLRQLTDNNLKKFWNKNQRDLKYRFGRMVYKWIAGLEYDRMSDVDVVEKYTKLNKRGTSKLRQFGRLLFGYNGLGWKIGVSITDLRSKASIGLPSDKNTGDHVVGVTLVGWLCHEKILECMNNGMSNMEVVDYMKNEWLYDHLHYWSMIQITRDEHKEENLSRDEHTLQEKLNLDHYLEAGIEVV